MKCFYYNNIKRHSFSIYIKLKITISNVDNLMLHLKCLVPSIWSSTFSTDQPVKSIIIWFFGISTIETVIF